MILRMCTVHTGNGHAHARCMELSHHHGVAHIVPHVVSSSLTPLNGFDVTKAKVLHQMLKSPGYT